MSKEQSAEKVARRGTHGVGDVEKGCESPEHCVQQCWRWLNVRVRLHGGWAEIKSKGGFWVAGEMQDCVRLRLRSAHPVGIHTLTNTPFTSLPVLVSIQRGSARTRAGAWAHRGWAHSTTVSSLAQCSMLEVETHAHIFVGLGHSAIWSFGRLAVRIRIPPHAPQLATWVRLACHEPSSACVSLRWGVGILHRASWVDELGRWRGGTGILEVSRRCVRDGACEFADV